MSAAKKEKNAANTLEMKVVLVGAVAVGKTSTGMLEWPVATTSGLWRLC